MEFERVDSAIKGTVQWFQFHYYTCTCIEYQDTQKFTIRCIVLYVWQDSTDCKITFKKIKYLILWLFFIFSPQYHVPWKFSLYITAIIDLNGRYFGGRIVKACFYNLDKFRRLDLGGEMDSSWRPWKRKFFQLVFVHKCTSIVCTFINEMAQRSSEILGLLKHQEILHCLVHVQCIYVHVLKCIIQMYSIYSMQYTWTKMDRKCM